MSARLGPARAWRIVLALVALLSFAAAVPLTVLSGQLGDAVIAAVIGVPCAAVGWVVARRHPGNPIGWLFLTISVFMFLGTAGGDYGYLVYKQGHHLPLAPAGLALAAFWGLSLTLFGVAVLLFPDGTLPSRFWRGALRLYCALFAAACPGHLRRDRGCAVRPPGPRRLHRRPDRRRSSRWLVRRHPGATGPRGHGAVAGLHRPAGTDLAARHRGPAPAAEMAGQRRRRQHHLPCPGHGVLSTPGRATTLLGAIGSAAWFGVAALPVSIGVAIGKYRLYDIDRIISRTLAYAIVTGLLVGVYAGLVLLAQEVLRFSSPVAVAASTLVAAALFNPVRRRVQHAVDRRFNRARYDADLTVTAFAARLQDAVDPDAVRADLAGVVHAALEPAHVSVWLRP